MSNFNAEMPIWVSRKNADGQIAQLTVPIWIFLLIGLLIILNLIVWGGYGLYEFVKVVA